MFDLQPAADNLAAVVDAIGDEQLEAPTPCEKYQVSGLLYHVIGLTRAFTDAAKKTADDSQPPEVVATADLPEGWREQIRAELDELAAAWREPAAWEGMTAAGGIELPGEVAAGVALQEIVVHGWDLAKATGQDFRSDPALTEHLLGVLTKFASEEGVPGLFGPKVDVDPGASPLDRAIGLTGRDPAWAQTGGR